MYGKDPSLIHRTMSRGRMGDRSHRAHTYRIAGISIMLSGGCTIDRVRNKINKMFRVIKKTKKV